MFRCNVNVIRMINLHNHVKLEFKLFNLTVKGHKLYSLDPGLRLVSEVTLLLLSCKGPATPVRRHFLEFFELKSLSSSAFPTGNGACNDFHNPFKHPGFSVPLKCIY